MNSIPSQLINEDIICIYIFQLSIIRDKTMENPARINSSIERQNFFVEPKIKIKNKTHRTNWNKNITETDNTILIKKCTNHPYNPSYRSIYKTTNYTRRSYKKCLSITKTSKQTKKNMKKKIESKQIFRLTIVGIV